MRFSAAAAQYDRFMGRHVPTLAVALADFAGLNGGIVLDVGCGPGATLAPTSARASPRHWRGATGSSTRRCPRR